MELYRLYRSYYDEDPEHRVPPIPSAIIPAIPAKKVFKYLKQKSFQDENDVDANPAVLEAISRSLWTGMRRLERDISTFPIRDVLHRVRCMYTPPTTMRFGRHLGWS